MDWLVSAVVASIITTRLGASLYPNVTGPSSSRFTNAYSLWSHILNRHRTDVFPVEGSYRYYILLTPQWLTEYIPECGDQLIMALSYTQKTSDNSLITKYVRKTLILLPVWLKLIRCVRTAIVVRSIRHLPHAERFVYDQSVFR